MITSEQVCLSQLLLYFCQTCLSPGSRPQNSDRAEHLVPNQYLSQLQHEPISHLPKYLLLMAEDIPTNLLPGTCHLCLLSEGFPLSLFNLWPTVFSHPSKSQLPLTPAATLSRLCFFQALQNHHFYPLSLTYPFPGVSREDGFSYHLH